MTAEAALYQFFNRFGITAYEALDVPGDAAPPYLTYDTKISGFGDSVSLTVNLWYRDSSNVAINAKARELKTGIKDYGMLPCDGGGIWLKLGSPWCQSVRNDGDPDIKRRYINVTAEFLTAG